MWQDMVQKKGGDSISCIPRKNKDFREKIRIAFQVCSDYNMGCILSEDADITDFLRQAG